MTLDARKITHIRANIAKIMKGRATSLNLTRKLANGTTTVLTINGVLKAGADFDPDFNAAGHGSEISTADALLQLDQQDITYDQLRSVIYIEPAAAVGGQQMASRYIPTSIEAKGLVPGGDRWILTLDRQRA